MVSRNVTGALLGLVLSGCSTPRQEQRSIDADPFTGKKVAILYPHNMGPSLGQSEALHQQFTPLNPELVNKIRGELDKRGAYTSLQGVYGNFSESFFERGGYSTALRLTPPDADVVVIADGRNPDFVFKTRLPVYFSTWKIITDYNHLRGNVGIEGFKLKKMEGK